MNKKILVTTFIFIISLSLLSCIKDEDIVVVTREEGSGTREAFIELSGILEKSNDTRKDRTTKEAITQMQTETVIQTVAGNDLAIGYVSTGSNKDAVKTLNINNVEPTYDNIVSGKYILARPFVLAIRDKSHLIEDFFNFIQYNGQDIISKHYIPIHAETGSSYKSSTLAGNIIIAGSTSVAPAIEPLAEEYMKLNPDIKIEIQQTGSSAGIMAAIEGNAHIAMSSRELSSEELKDLEVFPIALDGIAIIVNKNNYINNLSMNNLKAIYMGDIIDWDAIYGKES